MFQLNLERVVDRGESIRPDDLLGTKRALSDLGYYAKPAGGFTDFTDDEIFEGIEAFQRDKHLRVDGMMVPDGLTVRTINAALVARGADGPANTGAGDVGSRRPHVPIGLLLASGSGTGLEQPFAAPRRQSKFGSSDALQPGRGNDSLAGSSLNDALKQPGSAPKTPQVLGHVGATLGKSMGVNETPKTAEQDFQNFEAGMQGALARLAYEGIDAKRMREKYLVAAKKAFAETEAKVGAKALSTYQGALSAHKMRGDLMAATRREGTRLAAAIAVAKKRSNPPISFYQEKYADKFEEGKHASEFERKVIKSKMIRLSFEHQKEVWTKIIKSAGRPYERDTALAKRAGVAGRAFLGIGVALAIVNILDAEDMLDAAIREAAKVAGGVAGGAVGGATAGALTLTPFGVLVGVIAGGVLGAMGADVGIDKIMEFVG